LHVGRHPDLQYAADLVYAVKIRVPNEGGILKIGMPADVQFDVTSPAK